MIALLVILVVGGVALVLAVLAGLVLAYVVAVVARIVAAVLYVANGFTLGRPSA